MRRRNGRGDGKAKTLEKKTFGMRIKNCGRASLAKNSESCSTNQNACSLFFVFSRRWRFLPPPNTGPITAHNHPASDQFAKMAALTTSSVTAVCAVRGAKAKFAGSRAAFAAPARTAVSSRTSLTVKAAGRDLWCVLPPVIVPVRV